MTRIDRTPTWHDLHCVTARAIDLVRIGFSVSDATALAVMGKRLTHQAVRRVESVVAAATKEVRS